MSHHHDCPALFFADKPERCRCVFLVMLDELDGRLREGLARWGEDE